MHQASFFHLLLLIIVANAAPIIVRKLLHNKWNRAVDGGIVFFDGHPLLGHSKTWRGLVASVVITAIVGVVLGHSIQTGVFISLLAMSGDLVSSFIKRRLNKPASSMAPFLDQFPESFLPAFVMMPFFKLDLLSVFILVALFIIFELGVSVILYKWGIRKQPY